MKKIEVTYTMKKPEDVKETVETCIVLPVSDVVAQLVCVGTGCSDNMVRSVLEPIANLQGFVLDEIETIEVV